MAEQSTGKRGWIIAFCGLAVGIGVWLAWSPGQDDSSSGAGSAISPAAQPETPVPVEEEVAEVPAEETPEPTDYLFEDGGRMSIPSAYLPDQELVSFGLTMGNDARGNEDLKVVIASISNGRRLETTASPRRGDGSGLRLEIETDWLEPGQYMIQVKTAEKKPLSLRRFVLEVTE
jgi:hypothetical protein